MLDADYILWFKDISIDMVPIVGGKNAALGEMFRTAGSLGVSIPNGFAVSASAYNYFIDTSGLKEKIANELRGLDTGDVTDLARRGENVRSLILSAELPKDLADAVRGAYATLSEEYGGNTDVAVRSSATAEDLPDASFAGQQETFLNVRGDEMLLESVKKCFASLFTNRAISYRVDKGFEHADVALSVGVQKMVRSDIGTSGVMFSLDTETGFDKVVSIDASYGLGEMVVQGKVTPDSFLVFKPALASGKSGLISRTLGEKAVKMIYGKDGGGEVVDVSAEDRARFCLSDTEIEKLAKWAVVLEKHFSEKRGHYQPMDMEWAKDGETNELFIVQARPETVHASKDKTQYIEYILKEKGEVLVEGTAVGMKIAVGAVRVIHDVKDIGSFEKGEILVTEITDPDWEPIMKIASAIVTDKGGRTSHAAIVSRELGIPCIVGTKNATGVLNTGDIVTVDCSSGEIGLVYKGVLPFETVTHRLDNIPDIETKVMVNIGSPDEALRNYFLPVKGVGLGRLEFIINSYIRIHPNALLEYDKLKSDPTAVDIIRQIDELTIGYSDKKQFYIDSLAEGIAKIAAAFYPHDVIIRFSDFKSNEYRTLIGGERYEPEEQNPMIGWRGASRYYSEGFATAFGLECIALKKVREEMGLTNVVPMVPFCRTLEEADKVLDAMASHGLDRKDDMTLKVFVMCEIPSNVILAEKFLERFDGMSIGSNDLTQLTLGLDRDSEMLAGVGNETDEAVKELIRQTIRICKERGKYIGICGQAPSDFPEFTEFLVKEGIESISLSPDTVIKTLPLVAGAEDK
jgi:pyruvate, water dikinase